MRKLINFFVVFILFLSIASKIYADDQCIPTNFDQGDCSSGSLCVGLNLCGNGSNPFSGGRCPNNYNSGSGIKCKSSKTPLGLGYCCDPVPTPIGGGPTPTASFINPCPSGVCDTVLGPIHTDPGGFIKVLFQILLGVSGGIAMIIIITSGYSYMASQGNPEKIKGAQETLVSAVIGLAFIIFSTAILTIIGVDILGLTSVFSR